MADQHPGTMFRTLPRTWLGWWGFGLLGAGAALQLVQSALVWATGAGALDAAVREAVQHRQLLMDAMPGSPAAVALTVAAGKLLPP